MERIMIFWNSVCYIDFVRNWKPISIRRTYWNYNFSIEQFSCSYRSVIHGVIYICPVSSCCSRSWNSEPHPIIWTRVEVCSDSRSRITCSTRDNLNHLCSWIDKCLSCYWSWSSDLSVEPWISSSERTRSGMVSSRICSWRSKIRSITILWHRSQISIHRSREWI